MFVIVEELEYKIINTTKEYVSNVKELEQNWTHFKYKQAEPNNA